MQRQGSFAEAEYAGKKKQTRRDKFLAEMEQAVPWSRLVARLAPLYPKGERGRPPIPLERMLRVYFVQQWYGLADEAVEDALYDSQALRGFAGIALTRDPVPDATTVLHFRHWLERHDLTKGLFDEVGAMLEERGLLMRQSLPRRRPGGRSSMRPSLPPRLRRRTSSRAVIRRCTRRRRAISGTSG
jgi:transposase, IS5 family